MQVRCCLFNCPVTVPLVLGITAHGREELILEHLDVTSRLQVNPAMQ